MDYSPYLQWNSLSKSEALNNNKNTCWFTLLDVNISENEQFSIYDYVYNIQPISSADNFMYVNDTYQFENKYFLGRVIYVDIFWINKRMTISAVDPTTNKITFTTTFWSNIPVKAQHWFLFFAGVVDKVTQTRLSKSTTEMSYTYSVIGYEKLMDRKVVIDSYAKQYLREIFWRIVYKFVAPDSSAMVFEADTAMTWSGLCSNTTNYGTDKISWNYSQKWVCTGNWYRYKAFTSINLSVYTDLRYRWKIQAGQWHNMSKLTLRLGTNASNYFEYNNPHIWSDWEDCWMYETISLKYPDATVWSPSLSAITWMAFYYEGSAVNYFLFDSVMATTGWILMWPMKRGTVQMLDVRFNGIQPSLILEQLTKAFQHFWYVDYERKLHYYYEDWEAISTYQITPTLPTYNSLVVSVDTTQIVNRQLVEWNEAPAQALYTQTKKADWIQTSFTMDYKPAGEVDYPDGTSLQGLKAFVNGVEKTVGVEWLVDEATVNFVYNRSNKIIRNSSAYPVLLTTDTLTLTYYPYKTLSVRYADYDSINLMKSLVGGDGIFDGKIINDQTLNTIQLARQRAVVEVQSKKDPIVTYTFKTDMWGFELGQMVMVIDPDRGVNQYFQIQKVWVVAHAGNMFQYTIALTKKFFDYVEFFQLLFKKASNLQVNANAEIIIPWNDDEVIGIHESYTVLAVWDFYRACLNESRFWTFEDKIWTATIAWYIGSSTQERLMTGVATASFPSVSGYTKTKALELVTATDTTATAETELIPIKANTDFKIAFDVKILSQSGAGSISVFVNEYDSNKQLLATNTQTVVNTLPDFVNYLIELTTNNSISFCKVWVKIDTMTVDLLLGCVFIADQRTETVVNPWVAGFSFAGA